MRHLYVGSSKYSVGGLWPFNRCLLQHFYFCLLTYCVTNRTGHGTYVMLLVLWPYSLFSILLITLSLFFLFSLSFLTHFLARPFQFPSFRPRYGLCFLAWCCTYLTHTHNCALWLNSLLHTILLSLSRSVNIGCLKLNRPICFYFLLCTFFSEKCATYNHFYCSCNIYYHLFYMCMENIRPVIFSSLSLLLATTFLLIDS